MKNHKLQKKGGAISVFLAVILASLISISLMLVYSSRETAIRSCADGIFNLAGDSVLSEYDYYINKDYSLFLLKGTNNELSSALRKYVNYSLVPIKGVTINSASINAGKYSTAAIDPVRLQICDYMKSPGTINRLAKSDRNIENTIEDRILRHGPTIGSLPSRALPDKSILTAVRGLADNLKTMEGLLKSGSDKYLLDTYILSVFNDDIFERGGDHFFRNEIEYIICGETSDSKNRKETDAALVMLRTGLNLKHIYSDQKKLAAVEAASQILTPGVLGTVTQLGIATVWATAESVNDVKLLHKGRKVPIIKDSLSWATDLDAIIKGYDAEKGYLEPSVNKGSSYSHYLRMLLFIKDDNIKTARILDLIQINMRKNYDSDFLIRECSTGFSMSGRVNNREFNYDKIYK